MARLGEIIDGKYEVLREVGRGGMSVVYLAMDKRLNKQWAIKEFRKDKDDASKQIALKALLDEANLMKKLDHPTLPRIVDIIDDNQNVYVVMDYIEGESLNKVLDAYGAQPQEAVIEWAKQLSDVLDYLHTQNPPVIYRDMKPANIMLRPDGTVRLIDFGIAREYKEGKAGDTEAIGTRGYAAPEQFGGKGQTDARTDIYSLGVTLYHLVTGKNPAEPPYEIYPIRHWDPSLSSGFEWLIQKCTQLNPADRYQSCAEVTYVLENLPKFEGEYKKKQKSRINLFLAGVIATVVLTVACVSCFVGASSMKSQTLSSYRAMDSVEGCVNAIRLAPEDPQDYVRLAGLLRDNITTVTAGANPLSENEAMISDTISRGDISKWFPTDTLNTFRQDYPNEYARIQFDLGFMLWRSFDGDDADVIRVSIPYFKNVLLVAQDENVDAFAGLQEKEFNLASLYYRVCYFQQNQKSFVLDELNEVKDLDELKEIIGSEIEGSAYEVFWNTNVEILEMMLAEDSDMTAQVKLETLGRLAYLVQIHEICGAFIDSGVTEEQFVDFIGRFSQVLNGVPEGNSDYVAKKMEIKANLNRAIKFMNDAGIKVEEIV